MYCFTYVNYLDCILNDLLLWSEITSEHPIFISTQARLTNKNLSQEIINRLMDINSKFSQLKEEARNIKLSIMGNPYMSRMFSGEIRRLVNTFLAYDSHVLKLLPEIMKIGKEDEAWQELLEHIGQEQTFMYEAFTNILSQIS